MEQQLDQLEQKTSLTNPNCCAETDERLWTEFKTAFQAAYQDTTRTQDAYTALMQLEMKGMNIDTVTIRGLLYTKEMTFRERMA